MGCRLSIAARTALAISLLRSMNDWLSIALTCTVIWGAAFVWLLPDWDDAELDPAVVPEAGDGVALCSVALMATGGGGVYVGRAAGVELPPNRLAIPEISGDRSPNEPPSKLEATLPTVLPAECDPCAEVFP